MKTIDWTLTELSVKENENGTFSVVSANGGRLTFNKTIGKYKVGQDEFTRFKAQDILNHITDIEYKDSIDLVR